MKYYLFIILFITSFQQGCQIPSLDQNIKNSKDYFDLESFFKNEAEYLNSQKISIKKTITHNDTIEENVKQIVNWENELKIFSECDINKPSCKDRYNIDSNSTKNGFLTIHYETIEKKLPTQIIDIEILNKEVTSIMIINKETNTNNITIKHNA